MRKLLIGFGGLIVLVVAAVLVVPGMIDWNSYRAEIAAQAKSITGRDLVIAGDIKIAVLPSPAVIVNEVAFANIDGGSEGQMVLLDSLAVNVALGPLITGDIQVTKVRLVNPVVVLEVLADGRQNWVFGALDGDSEVLSSQDSTTPSAGLDLTPGQSESGSGNGSMDLGPGLQLDNFEIIGGTVIYRDAVSGAEEQIEDLNATFKAVSLTGPFESIGLLKVRGIPVSYEIGVDGVFQGRTVPVTATVRSDTANASLSLVGNIVNLSEDAKFKGVVRAEGESVAALVAAIAGPGTLPGAVNQSFSLEGEVSANAVAIGVDSLSLKLGDTSATGLVDVDLSDGVSASVDVAVNHANLDRILALPPYGVAAAATTAIEGDGGTTNTSSGASLVAAPEKTAVATTGSGGTMAIPDGIDVSLALGIEAITYQGQKAGPVRLNAELANGEITLSQFSSQLPGATDVYVSGFVTIQDGAPVFEGDSEIAVGDTQGLSQWLQLDMPVLPNGRMRRVDARASIRANMEQVQVSGIEVAFDGSRLLGGVTLALRKRLAFGASFILDRIDLEGYLPSEFQMTGAESETVGSVSDDVASESTDSAAATNTQQSEAPNPLAVLNALTTFDANIKAEIGEIIYNGTPIRKIALDGTLDRGDLTLKKASVSDMAGASVSMIGAISELGGNPRFGGLRTRFKAKSIARLVKLLGVDLPISPKALGAVATAVTLDGPMLQPSMKGLASAAGAQVTFDGGMSLLPVKDLINGEVTVKHGDVAGLLRALGVSYRPSGNIGGLDLSTRVSGGADSIDLENISGALGALAFNGSTKVRLDGDVPNIKATINTNEFAVDPFLPAQQNASFYPDGGASSFDVTPRPVITGGAPWSDDPLDLSALNSLDGDFRIRSDAIRYGSYRFEEADIIARLTDGVLKADRVTGKVFGGRVSLKGLVNAQATPLTEATLSFENASVSSLLSSLTGAPTAAGALTFETALNARGPSVADMVAALNGAGSFTLKGLDVKGSAKGTPFAGLLGLVQGFGQLGSGLSGQSADGLADVTGSYVLTNGVAQIGDFRLLSGLGNGAAAGSVDLAGWTMDVSGTLKLTQNVLGQLLTQKAGAPQELPFSVSGALDSPSVKLETASLGGGSGGGATLPGLDKLDEKVPGLGGLLQGVLGGTIGGGSSQQQQQQTPPAQSGSETQSGTPEPQPQPQQQPQQQEITPQDVLKQLLQF